MPESRYYSVRWWRIRGVCGPPPPPLSSRANVTLVVRACPYGTSQDLRCCVTGLSSLQSNFDQATGLDPGLHNNYVEAAYITEPRYPTSDISPDLNPFLASTNPPEPNPYLPLTNPLNSNPFSPQQAAGDNSNLYPADNSNSNPFAAWNK